MKRLISLLLVCALCAAISPRVFALEPTYTPSEAYEGSVYATRLKAVSLTGDWRTDLVAVAASQVGYHEGNSVADLAGGNTAGSQNYTEYGSYFGKETMGNNGWYYAWCAMFVTWCARQARIPISALNNAAYARADGATSTAGNSRFHINAVSPDLYLPQPGDLIFFDWSGERTDWDHIGIVESVANGVVHTLEGNNSARVGRFSYALTDSVIRAYGVLNGLGGIDPADPYTYPVPTADLSKGSGGDQVKWLQAALNKLGEALTVDADFGSLTQAAVVRFQTAQGLKASGVVDAETRAALIAAVAPLPGDLNDDGALNSRDYLLLRRVLLEGTSLLPTPHLAADVDGNGSINARDYLQVRKLLLGAA